MNYYFVDYENVHLDGLEGYMKLGEEDIVCVMYTEQSKSITLDIVDTLSRQNTRLESFKVSTGKKNSLDFQLSTYLGYIIAKNDDGKMNYFIVSKDTGYDNVADFWNKRGISVERIANIAVAAVRIRKAAAEAKKEQSKKKSIPELQATKEDMMEYLDESEYSDDILGVFNSYKTKQAICNGMNKLLKDTKKSSAIYKKLKPLMKKKNRS